MNALSIVDNTVTMTSLELVDYINSERGGDESELRHDNFMAKVPKVLGEAAPKFLGTAFYVNGTGAQVERAIYTFPKREACLMAMSYSYDLQAKVFDRMTALEAQAEALARFNLPKTYSAAMRLAADQADQIDAQKAQLSIAAPKADALDRIALSDGSLCLTDAAKTLQIQPRKFTQLLQEKGWLYRRPTGAGWLAYQDRIQQGVLEHKTTTGEKSDGSEWTGTQVRVTPKGLAKLAVVLGEVA